MSLSWFRCATFSFRCGFLDSISSLEFGFVGGPGVRVWFECRDFCEGISKVLTVPVCPSGGETYKL